jgi:hypothetical protein
MACINCGRARDAHRLEKRRLPAGGREIEELVCPVRPMTFEDDSTPREDKAEPGTAVGSMRYDGG